MPEIKQMAPHQPSGFHTSNPELGGVWLRPGRVGRQQRTHTALQNQPGRSAKYRSAATACCWRWSDTLDREHINCPVTQEKAPAGYAGYAPLPQCTCSPFSRTHSAICASGSASTLCGMPTLLWSDRSSPGWHNHPSGLQIQRQTQDWHRHTIAGRSTGRPGALDGTACTWCICTKQGPKWIKPH